MTIKKRSSPNFNTRPQGTPIDLIVLHYTDMSTTHQALNRLCDPAYAVSAHYLIAENGDTYQIVADFNRAWHAGISAWDGRDNVNDYSIGIELSNPGHSHGYCPFPTSQIDALIPLLYTLCGAHNIDPARVVGHSDIAPTRKQDPGHLFPWHDVYKRGYGMWPDASASAPTGNTLQRIGYTYDSADEALAIKAFQRHFRPSRIDGVLDLETLKLMEALSR